MSGYFDGVAVKKRIYSPEDYRDCAYVLGAIAKKDCVIGRYDRKSTSYALKKTETAIYFIADEFYSHTSDGKVYVYKSSTPTELCTVGTTTPVGVEITLNGNTVALFIGESSFYVADDVASQVNLSACDCAAVHNGRLFTASGTKIKFSSPFDFESNSVVLDEYGFIGLPKDAGDVLGFMSKNDILYVICSRALFSLETCTETIDFKVKRLNINGLDVVKNTVSVNNGVCYFVNCGKVCLFDGSSVKVISKFFRKESASPLGKSGVSDGLYILPAKVNNSRHIYVLSLSDYSESVFDYASMPLVADGGYHAYGSYAYTFYENPAFYGGFAYMIDGVDFGDTEVKKLLGITVRVGAACTLTITGIFGTKTFTLKKGLNHLKLNLSSDYFKIDFRGAASHFHIKDLKYEYTKKGE